MTKDATEVLLKTALIKEPPVPERIALKFKVQGSDEEIEDFGDAARVLGLMISETEGLRRTMVLQGQARLGNIGRPELAGALEGKVWEMMEAGLEELKAVRLDCLMGNGGRTAEGDRRKARKVVETVALGWRNLGKITLGDLTPQPPGSRHFVHPSRSRQ